MKELGEGSRDIIVSTTGWDINPRVLGIVPKEAAIATLRGFHWVSDAFFMTRAERRRAGQARRPARPDGLGAAPAQQAVSYDEGYLYPGPAVRDVPLSMAPSQQPGGDRASSAGRNTPR